MLVILVLTTIPSDGFSRFSFQIPHLDKLVHFCMYLGLGFLTFRSWSQTAKSRNTAWLAVLFCVLYGMMDEVHQLFLIDRTADVIDWIMDATGSIFGVMFYGLYLRMTHNKAGVKEVMFDK